MIPCISEVTTLPATFEADVRTAGSAECEAIEVWLTKLETHLETQSLESVNRLVSDFDVRLAAAAVQGGILLTQGDARREAFNLFERRLERCESLHIPVLVVAAEFAGQIAESDYERAVVSLKQAGQLAARRGVRLALEFQCRAAFCNNLSTAAAIVEHCDEPNVGICLDVFHYYNGPSKFEDFGLLPPERLFHVQLCDVAGTPRELAGDSDRVLPGDGDFQLAPIIDHLCAIGYNGCVSVELMNPHIWKLDPAQVVEIAITSLRRLLEPARG